MSSTSASPTPPATESSPRLLVVDDPDDVPEHPAGWEVVGTAEYLFSRPDRWEVGTSLWNCSRALEPLQPGYFVSLLGGARGHAVLPNVRSLVRAETPAPPLRVRPAGQAPTLGVLYDEASPLRPCRPDSIEHLCRIAAGLGVASRVFDETRLEALEGCDGLFIRTPTDVGNPAWRFAERAEALGIPVIDDTTSILRCSNKAFQAEHLPRFGVPLPRTRLVYPGNAREVAAEIGLPCVVKAVNGCFGREVFRVETEEQLIARVEAGHAHSALMIAQRFIHTEFDWRIGALHGELLFAARYNYIPGYWKCSRWSGEEQSVGVSEAVPSASVPAEVAAVALRAARAIGLGFYGLDIKETAEGVFVLEVNDNVDLDVDCEDAAEGEPLYHRIIEALIPDRSGWRAG